MNIILIVDDEERFREQYKKMLTNEGHKVFEASCAADARDILKYESIDLILLDINMPDVDGTILDDIIQAFHKNIRVIVSSVLPVYEQKARVPNAFDYFDKSEGLAVLLDKVKAAFK